MPISSEEYHTKLNDLLVETVTKMLRGESSTDGGTDWEDAERFLALAVEYINFDLDISAYPDGRLRVSLEIVNEGGDFIAPTVKLDVAEFMNQSIEDERRDGGNPDALLADYKAALVRLSSDLK